MAKPDNRADNAAHLQEHIDNTVENIHATEDYLDEHADEISVNEKQTLQEKNERREDSINAFANELKDETHNA